MTSLNGSFQGLIPKEPKILARADRVRQAGRLTLLLSTVQMNAVSIMRRLLY